MVGNLKVLEHSSKIHFSFERAHRQHNKSAKIHMLKAPISVDIHRSFGLAMADQFSRHFRRFKALFVFFKKKPKKSTPLGAGGVPRIFFSPQILFFLCVKTPCKILEPYDNPFWEKSNPAERRERERREKRK